jgi:predicted kinase
MEKKELKVIICVGLPASGKSTWTKQKLLSDPSYVRVSRDEFRFMLRNTPMTEPKLEEMITTLVEKTIVQCLKKRMNVIVDNCHVKASYINPIVKLVEYMADVEYMVFDVPAKKCIERDLQREKSVGEAVILEMDKSFQILRDTFPFQNQSRKPHYLQPRIQPVFEHELPQAVIFDIDGTLAHMGRRSPFDWDKVDHDDLNEIVAEQAQFHKAKGRTVLVVSGRDGSCKGLTEFWLNFHNIPFDELLMRPAGDFRKDSVIKKEIYLNNIKERYNVLCVYDDRLQVLDVWYKLGIFTFNVNQGNLDF